MGNFSDCSISKYHFGYEKGTDFFLFVVLLKSLINPSLNCALFFFPWCFPPELSQPIVTFFGL